MRALLKPKLFGWLPLLALLAGVAMLGAIRESRIVSDVAWAPGCEAGLQQARQSHRPLLLSFHTPGCDWCAKMDAETFADPQVVELARRFVCIRLNSDMDAPLATRYHVLSFPTIILADSQGKPLTEVA